MVSLRFAPLLPTNAGAKALVTIYNVAGYGEKARTRMDVKTGREAEHTIIKSLTAYKWVDNQSSGYKFRVAPVPYREFFGIEWLKLSCKMWDPDDAIFAIPKHVRFVTVTEKCPTGCP